MMSLPFLGKPIKKSSITPSSDKPTSTTDGRKVSWVMYYIAALGTKKEKEIGSNLIFCLV